jgi:hypothetical protein
MQFFQVTNPLMQSIAQGLSILLLEMMRTPRDITCKILLMA